MLHRIHTVYGCSQGRGSVAQCACLAQSRRGLSVATWPWPLASFGVFAIHAMSHTALAASTGPYCRSVYRRRCLARQLWTDAFPQQTFAQSFLARKNGRRRRPATGARRGRPPPPLVQRLRRLPAASKRILREPSPFGTTTTHARKHVRRWSLQTADRRQRGIAGRPAAAHHANFRPGPHANDADRLNPSPPHETAHARTPLDHGNHRPPPPWRSATGSSTALAACSGRGPSTTRRHTSRTSLRWPPPRCVSVAH